MNSTNKIGDNGGTDTTTLSNTAIDNIDNGNRIEDTNNTNTDEHSVEEAIHDAEACAVTQPGADLEEEEEIEGSDNGQQQPETEADEEVGRFPSDYQVEEELEESVKEIAQDTNNTDLTNNEQSAEEAIHDAEVHAVTESHRTEPGAFRVEGPDTNSPTEEEEREGSDHGQQPETEADEEVCRIPSAYLVEEDEESVKGIAQAEKVGPYYQRREGQLTIGIVGGLCACLAIILGVFLSRGDKNGETTALVEVTDKPTSAPTLDPRPTLTIVLERGVVNCGIEDVNREGGINLAEYNIDQCRALAATIFGDPTKMNLVIVGADDRYEKLLNHEVDVLYAGDSFTLEKLVREVRDSFYSCLLS